MFDDVDQFQELVQDEELFWVYVCDCLEQFCSEWEVVEDICWLMFEVLVIVYIDIYSNFILVFVYVLVLWFYEFDVDNWFFWECI